MLSRPNRQPHTVLHRFWICTADPLTFPPSAFRSSPLHTLTYRSPRSFPTAVFAYNLRFSPIAFRSPPWLTRLAYLLTRPPAYRVPAFPTLFSLSLRFSPLAFRPPVIDTLSLTSRIYCTLPRLLTGYPISDPPRTSPSASPTGAPDLFTILIPASLRHRPAYPAFGIAGIYARYPHSHSRPRYISAFYVSPLSSSMSNHFPVDLCDIRHADLT